MLRVAISSFYDYLTVVVKCFQEFDTTLLRATTTTTIPPSMTTTS